VGTIERKGWGNLAKSSTFGVGQSYLGQVPRKGKSPDGCKEANRNFYASPKKEFCLSNFVLLGKVGILMKEELSGISKAARPEARLL